MHWYLEARAGDVGDHGSEFHGLFEEDAERLRAAVAREGRLVLRDQLRRAAVHYLAIDTK